MNNKGRYKYFYEEGAFYQDGDTGRQVGCIYSERDGNTLKYSCVFIDPNEKKLNITKASLRDKAKSLFDEGIVRELNVKNHTYHQSMEVILQDLLEQSDNKHFKYSQSTRAYNTLCGYRNDVEVYRDSMSDLENDDEYSQWCRHCCKPTEIDDYKCSICSRNYMLMDIKATLTHPILIAIVILITILVMHK